MQEHLIIFNTDYGEIQRSVFCADAVKVLNPNISLNQSRLVVEKLVNSMVGSKGNLVSRIIELDNIHSVDKEIISAMHNVRMLGNLGSHDNMVFWKEAVRALNTLFKIMQWYGTSKHRLIKNSHLVADVQFCIASCYKEGIIVESDEKKYIEWLTKSSKNCHPCALRSLGMEYFEGKYLQKDYHKTIKYLEKAIENGSIDAKCFLGIIYAGSYDGINHDEELAFNLLTDSAKDGNLLAEYNLAEHFDWHHCKNFNIPHKPEDMFRRYKRIVEEGMGNNIYNIILEKSLIKLGDCYYFGTGTKTDFHEAFICYNKAAKMGNVIAIYKIAQCYETGNGINKDIEKAKKYYFLAASKGHQLAAMKSTQLSF